jgi:hypothetical protein
LFALWLHATIDHVGNARELLTNKVASLMNVGFVKFNHAAQDAIRVRA